MARSRRILGIDPGLVKTGWGFVEAEGSRLRHIANGECASGRGTLGARLLALQTQLNRVLQEYKPDEAAVEESFVHRNARAALMLGHSRAVVLLAAASAGVPLAEYAPNAVKRTVTGSGHADKRQVAYMIRALLPGVELTGEHAADALAVAICHVSQSGGVLGELTGRIARRSVGAEATG